MKDNKNINHSGSQTSSSVGGESKKLKKAIRHKAKSAARRTGRYVHSAAKKTAKGTARSARAVHKHVAQKPHHKLMERGGRYHRWHAWKFHKHVHVATLAIYLLIVIVMIANSYGRAFAADLSKSWNFSDAGDYSYDSNTLEVGADQMRLKAQNYAKDENTAALYHFDEVNGSTATDSSDNGNNASLANTGFEAGNLNNGLSLNGTDSSASVPDSASLSLGQRHTLEGWFKLNDNFSAGSHNQRQPIIDKGDYQLYLDNETGKLTYEIASQDATSWTQVAGNDINDSWDLDGIPVMEAFAGLGDDIYVGGGSNNGDAEVWKWDGSTWTKIAGDGVNNCWPANTYERVSSLTADGGNLYAGLGNTAGDAEVWKWDGSTWNKIGGDAINNSWPVSSMEYVQSMTHVGGYLYAGLGATANDAEVWRWDGASWEKIGGDSLNSGWATNYEIVYTLINDGTNVYAGLSATAGDAEVWRWNGSSWAKIGGDGQSSSWADATYEYVLSMTYMNGNLYAGIGITANDAEVWRWNGTSWSQIGGDSMNSGWGANYEGVYSLTNDGTNVYAGLGLTAGDNEVWRWNGSSWAKIGGDGQNASFTNTHLTVNALAYHSGKLYAGINTASGNASGQVWVFDDDSWTLIGGDYINHSWGFRGLQSVETMKVVGDKLYAGTGYSVPGNAMVWQFDGSAWQIIGGQGLNNSWAANTYESVLSMTSLNNKLYVGVGTGANEGELWEWNGETWTQIGGDSLNSGWGANYEEVASLIAFNDAVYAGIGNSNGDAEVWRWDGESWEKIGGDSINSGWNTVYNRISAFAVYNGSLHVGLGSTANEAEVWRWNGSIWEKVGGDGLNDSWPDVIYDQVDSLVPYHDKLYAGLGLSTGEAEVWEYDGSDWVQIGGDDVNGSWNDGTYERVRAMVVYNGDLYTTLGTTAGDAEVWRWNGSSWTRIGGNGLNAGWGNFVEETISMAVYKGRLYVGNGLSGNADAAIWAIGENGYLQSSTNSFDTSWHHAAATYNGTTMKLFIDGAEVGSKTRATIIPDGSRNLLLGSSAGGNGAGGTPRAQLDGMLDEVRLSSVNRTSFTTAPYTAEKVTVQPNEAAYKTGVKSFESFAAAEETSGGNITYRLSDDDGATWKYWNGNEWATAASLVDANSQSEIDDHISDFPVTFKGVLWQAVMDGDGDQRVALESVSIEANSDSIAPETNASDLKAYKVKDGAEIASNAWTNGSSPYFTWQAAEDGDSDILGYCLYLGQDDSADPRTSKGLLGTSPVETADICPFIVSGNELDLANSGLLGSELTTSTQSYYLRVKAIDTAGNLAEEASQLSFRFDNTPPSNPGFVSAPSGFINTKAVTITWPSNGGQAASDGASGVAGLQYKINGTSWYGDSHNGNGDSSDLLANDGSYSTNETPDFNNINEGINTVYFRTWDQAGNISTGTISAVLKINTAGSPSEPQDLSVTPDSNSQNAFSFSWSTPDSFVGDADKLNYCYTVNALPSSSSCVYTGTGVTTLAEGPYATQPGENRLYVVARDESNNINYSSYASVAFQANTTAPGAPTNADVVDVSVKNTSNWRLALTWEPPTDAGSGISSYKIYRSENNNNFSFVGSSTSTTYIDANLDQKLYFYYILACDSTNNCGVASTRVNMTPTGKFTEPAGITSQPKVEDVTTKRATIRWSTDRTSDSKIAIGTASGNYAPSEVGNSKQVTDHTIELDNLSAGTTYYIKAKWTDEDGNTGSSQEYSFTTAPAPVVKEVKAVKVGLNSAIIEFTSFGANKINLYYGNSESFGGLKSINTSTQESTYSIEITGLTDGTKYFYSLGALDSEGTEYRGNVYTMTTPQQPRIYNLQFQPVAGAPTSTQSITWQTNVPSTSLITYGKEGSAGTDVQDSQLKTDHKVVVSGLEDDSQYFLLAQSRDGNGNLAVSDRQSFRTAKDTRPPTVSNISIETSIRGSGAEARGQVIVSWDSDEPSTSQVGYAEGSGATVFNNKTTEDTQLTTKHIVVVSDLPPSKVYSIQPVSRDGSGNAGYGEIQPAIIGRANESILTIILNTLQKVFGL